MFEGEGGGDFKESRMRFPFYDVIANLGQRRRHRLFRNHLATYANALTESDEVRGCEQTGAIFLRATDRVDHGADRAFAIGAGDMNDARAGQVDMQLVDQPPDVFQSELDAEALKAVEPGERLPVFHCVEEK